MAKYGVRVSGGRHILHVVAGDDEWYPSTDEMTEIAELFRAAYDDPTGSVVVTRTGVHVMSVTTLLEPAVCDGNCGCKE